MQNYCFFQNRWEKRQKIANKKLQAKKCRNLEFAVFFNTGTNLLEFVGQ